MKWYYYLHTNGDLIGKNPVVVDSDASYFDSPFVKKTWIVDTELRETCWTFLLEALASGARIDRVKELSKKWNCDLKDAVKFMCHLKANDEKPTEQMKEGLRIFAEKVLEMDEDEFWKKAKKEFDKNNG